MTSKPNNSNFRNEDDGNKENNSDTVSSTNRSVTNVHTFDGRNFSTYTEMVEAKRKRNTDHMVELGLVAMSSGSNKKSKVRVKCILYTCMIIIHTIYFVDDEQTTKREKKRTSTPLLSERRRSPRLNKMSDTNGVEGTKNVVTNRAVAVPPTMDITTDCVTLQASQSKEFEELRDGFTHFNERVEALKAYKEKYGHTKVHKKDDKSLYDWCANMRGRRRRPEKYPKTRLTPDRIAVLDAIGFDWKPTLLRWCLQSNTFKEIVSKE